MGKRTTAKLLTLAVGIGLVLFPEPITTASGIVVILAGLGIKE